MAKVAGASGAVLADEAVVSFIYPVRVVNTPTGVAMAGGVHSAGKLYFAAMAFDDRLAGRKLLIRTPGAPEDRKLLLTSKDAGFFTPIPTAAAAPTAVGATLGITNPVTNETVSIPLPAIHWASTGKSTPGSTVYKYLDRTLSAGPCKVVVLKGNSGMKAKCTGASLGFTLDEAAQGQLDVRLVLPGGFARCASFGGTLLRDEQGQFIAKDSVAPAGCDEGF